MKLYFFHEANLSMIGDDLISYKSDRNVSYWLFNRSNVVRGFVSSKRLNVGSHLRKFVLIDLDKREYVCVNDLGLFNVDNVDYLFEVDTKNYYKRKY